MGKNKEIITTYSILMLVAMSIAWIANKPVSGGEFIIFMAVVLGIQAILIKD